MVIFYEFTFLIIKVQPLFPFSEFPRRNWCFHAPQTNTGFICAILYPVPPFGLIVFAVVPGEPIPQQHFIKRSAVKVNSTYHTSISIGIANTDRNYLTEYFI